jgi:hypothetical protein
MDSVLHLSSGRQVHQQVLETLQRLHNVFGANLVVTKLGAGETTFHVRGLTNEVAMRTMMAMKVEIFGAEVPAGGGCVLGPGDFQILSSPTDEAAGLTLRHLPSMPDGSEYRSGFWYY